MLRALALLGEHQRWLNSLSTESYTYEESSNPSSSSTSTPTSSRAVIKRKENVRSPYFAGESEMRTRSGLHTTFDSSKKKENAHQSRRQKVVTGQEKGQLNTPPGTPAKSKSETASIPLRSTSRIGLENKENKNVDQRPPTPDSLPRTRIRRSKRDKDQQPDIGVDESKKRKLKKIEVVVEIPTLSKSKEVPSRKRERKDVVRNGNQSEHGVDGVDEKKLLARSEKGVLEKVGKIHLIQERLRDDPWKMLIATSLLNKTSGRAARPILEILLDTWQTPQALAEASIPDLASLLYPLGLYNQRAASLVRFSRQYLDFGWDEIVKHRSKFSSAPPPPIPIPVPSSMETESLNSPQPKLDVKVFHGSGLYASDSFRIFSPLLNGRGAPDQEGKWLGKRERAIERICQAQKARHVAGHTDTDTDNQPDKEEEEEEAAEYGVEEVADHMSDEGDDDEDGGDEWRKVVPNDKELRRYLIWRWGIEGIVYDIQSGPQISRERDMKRLASLDL